MLLDRELVDRAAGFVGQSLTAPPRFGIVSGSGLGGASACMDVKSSIPYDIIPEFPVPTVKGHDGELLSGMIGGVSAVFMRGRVHYYEGRSMPEVAFPVVLLYELGARTLVLMSSVGGISEELEPGTVMVVEDHINLMGSNPLRSRQAVERPDSYFVDMTGAYDAGIAEMAFEAAAEAGIRCVRGVLAAVSGPSYETPAEVRMLAKLGADAVCMSMVPEVIAARYLGMKVLGLAVVTNRAAGLAGEGPSHNEVLDAAQKVSGGIADMLTGLLGRMEQV